MKGDALVTTSHSEDKRSHEIGEITDEPSFLKRVDPSLRDPETLTERDDVFEKVGDRVLMDGGCHESPTGNRRRDDQVRSGPIEELDVLLFTGGRDQSHVWSKRLNSEADEDTGVITVGRSKDI